MATTLFDLYFSGKTTGTDELDQIRRKVGKIFDADENTLELLFSGKPIRIKSGVDQDTAIRYRVVLREAGALLDIRPQKRSDVASPSSDSQTGDGLVLLPPKTGDLSDCAAPVPSFPLPDIDKIVLAPAGSVIDLTEQAPPPTIDTDGLTMTEPNTGSLEDCRAVVDPRPIPNIDYMELAHQEPAAKPDRSSDD